VVEPEEHPTASSHPRVKSTVVNAGTAKAIKPYLGLIEQLLLGWFDGMGGLSDAFGSTICKESLISSTTGIFALLEFHEFYKPTVLLELALSGENLNKNINMAYAYCDFSAFHSVFANLFAGIGNIANLIPSTISESVTT